MTALTALGQHSMVPPFYANRAKVALRATTAREAPSMSKVNSEHAGSLARAEVRAWEIWERMLCHLDACKVRGVLFLRDR